MKQKIVETQNYIFNFYSMQIKFKDQNGKLMLGNYDFKISDAGTGLWLFFGTWKELMYQREVVTALFEAEMLSD